MAEFPMFEVRFWNFDLAARQSCWYRIDNLGFLATGSWLWFWLLLWLWFWLLSLFWLFWSWFWLWFFSSRWWEFLLVLSLGFSFSDLQSSSAESVAAPQKRLKPDFVKTIFDIFSMLRSTGFTEGGGECGWKCERNKNFFCVLELQQVAHKVKILVYFKFWS